MKIYYLIFNIQLVYMKKQPIIKDSTGYLDRIISNFIMPTLPLWHSIGVTPNILTTFGLISSILSLIFFYTYKTVYSVIFFIFRWYFDYADGMLARKYKQTSKFGDWYDHVTDWLFFIGYVIVLYSRSTNTLLHMFVLSIAMVLFSIQFGCMEKANYKYYKEESSVSRLRHLCIENDFFLLTDNSVLYLVMIYLLCNV